MAIKREAKQIIKALQEGDLVAECPCCGESMKLRDAGLFYLEDFTEDATSLYKEYLSEIKERRKELRERRKQIPTRSETAAISINIGMILERICPSLKSFCFDKNDCRSLFDPIDYVIFEGLANGGTVSRIIFSEIKTGRARLTAKQKQIKGLVENKKVDFDVYKMEK